MEANINSSQAVRKTKMAVAMIPGIDKGMTKRNRTPNGVTPSIRAASSIEGGMDLKYPCSIQIAKGKLNAL